MAAALGDLQARLDAFVARVRTETGVPAVALAVSMNGARFHSHAGTVHADEPRPVTKHTRFRLGCAGKLLLAIAALELESRGALDTAATIGEYLPELRGSLHGDAVRVSHLLSHTSGYRGTNVLDLRTRAFTWPSLVEHLCTSERLFAPGSVFSYEHTEAVLLGEILQRAAREPHAAIVEREVLEPLGIGPASCASGHGADAAGRHRFDETSNRFVALDAPPVPPFWHAAFSERTVSLADLLIVGEAAIGGHGGAPLADATRRRLRGTVVRLPAAAGGPLRELLPVAFGLGAAELADGSHGTTGVSAGQCVGLRFDERAGLAVAVGLNAMVPYLRDFLLTTVVRDLAQRERAAGRERFHLPLAHLEGEYFGPGSSTVEVRHDGGRLICAIGREGERERVIAELALDDDERPILHSPLPHLSLAFFRVPDGDVGLMVGLSAYKRRNANRPFQR